MPVVISGFWELLGVLRKSRASWSCCLSLVDRWGRGEVPCVEVRIFVLERFKRMPSGGPSVAKRWRKKKVSTYGMQDWVSSR